MSEYIDKEMIEKNIEGKYPKYVKSYHGIAPTHVYDMGGGVISDNWRNMDHMFRRDEMPYRIESYVHSDSVTPNKHGSLVKVSAETDAAVRTETFSSLCKKIAQYACGYSTNSIRYLLEETNIKEEIEKTSKELKEKIEIKLILFI